METISQLVPFQFKNFVFPETLNDLTVKEVIHRHRFTRKAIGVAWDAKFPQQYIDKLIERHPDIGEGMQVTVTCESFTVKGVTGQEYFVKTHDTLEIYQMAIYSELPRAKEFLKVFPEFLCAVCSGLAKTLPPDIYQIAQIPDYTHGKGEVVGQIAQERGISIGSVYRMIRRIRTGEPLEKPHGKYIQFRYREKFKEAIQLKKENPNLRGHQIAQKIGVPRSVVYEWIKKSSHNLFPIERKAA
jgi:transposase-like protein